MILSREQINRYLRHIIIPEISGQGQKKIIDSSVFIFADEVKAAAALLYYLAASGVGNISCCFIDIEGYEKIFDNIRGLNSDCTIELIDIKTINQENTWPSKKTFSISVFMLKKDKINDVLWNYLGIKIITRLIPTVFAIYDEWKGFIKVFDSSEDAMKTNFIFKDLKDCKYQEGVDEEASILSTGLLGAIGSIEVIKTILGIGTKCEIPLFFDLIKMEFSRNNSQNISNFFSNVQLKEDNKTNVSVLKKYNMPKTLKNCKVLIVGTGGLGSPAALSLAGAGVGTIGLMDYDSVELSNLNRQILHSTSRIGMPKVESAKEFIINAYSDINIVTYNVGLNRDNVMDIIREYDVIIDAVDNFPTRYLLNDACYFAGKPMIEAGAVKFSGLNMTILPGVGTCYRCMFPDMPEAGSIQSCSEVGVLGPVPGVIGFIQAAETVKLLTGKGRLLVNKIMYFDALDLDFDIISIDRTTKCRLCGNTPSITELMQYDFSCDKKS